MNEEELYKLAISDVLKYSLLNEILAIRDNRFPNEEVDYCINVNGYISLDVLNKYVRNINELEQLQNNWNELDKWLIEKLKEYQKSKYPGEYGLVLGFIWEMQCKMQELEANNE